MIDFTKTQTDPADCWAIASIASRAASMDLLGGRERIDLIMDLKAAHRVCPMNLSKLLEAETCDFIDDVCDIMEHLDRETGELVNGFRPRFAL